MSDDANHILNFAQASNDLFASEGDGASSKVFTEDGKVHIRLRQRNARQRICTVEGLPRDIDFGRVLRHLKKTLCCNGIVVKDEALGRVLQFQGDHRKAIAQFIVAEELVASKDMVKVHGYE